MSSVAWTVGGSIKPGLEVGLDERFLCSAGKILWQGREMSD